MLQLWFVSRALGAMALLLLSLVIVLGILHNTSVVKNAELGLPRFVLVALHRNLSLISVIFIALHVITVIVTDYVHLRVVDVFVPGIAAFNPVAAAFGTVATDLTIAIILSSMLRSRFSRRVWFWVHWTSYLCWPITVVHAVLNVSFRGTTWWTLAIPFMSMIAIIAALVYRRRDRRRVNIPVAERGRVTDTAIKQVTGEIPIPQPTDRPSGAQAAAGRAGGTTATTGAVGASATTGVGGTAAARDADGTAAARDADGTVSTDGGEAGGGGAPDAATEVMAPAPTEVMAPAPTAGPSGRPAPGRHRAAGEDALEATTEVMPPSEPHRRGVVPLEPRSTRR